MPLPGSGVAYASLFEWCDAAIFNNYRLEDFFQTDVFWQNLAVAYYRGKKRLEAVLSHREARKAKERQRKHGLGNRPITG